MDRSNHPLLAISHFAKICVYIVLYKYSTFYTPAKRMFFGAYRNQPVHRSVCPDVHISVCVQNASFCQSAGGGIKSHIVTALLF